MGSLLALAAFGILSAMFTNDMNKANMKEQMNWNEEMMDKQNEYNAPSAQMHRLRSAGINPNASMGVGTFQTSSAGVNSSNLLPMTDPSLSMGNLASNMMSAFNLQQQGLSDKTLREQRLDNLEAETEQLRASANSLGVSSAGQVIINRYVEAEKEFGLKNFQADLDLKYQQVATLRSTEKREYATIEQVFPAEVKKYLSEANVNFWDAKQVIANIDKIRAETELASSEAELYSAKTETEALNQDNLRAQTGLVKEETELKSQESDYYSKVTDKYLEQLDASVKQLSASAGLSEEQTYWYLFELMSKNNFKIGPVTFNPTGTNIKGGFGIDKEYNQRYGSSR